MKRIITLGDSNTRFQLAPGGDYQLPGPGALPCWPEFAAEEAPEYAWLNFAIGGTMVCDAPPFWTARVQLANAQAYGAVGLVVAAFGTNDIRILHKTRDEIVSAYCALRDLCAPAPLVVCTTPWCTEDRPDLAQVQTAILDLNARLLLLEKNVPDWWVVECFNYGQGVDALSDGVHVTEAGQRERAHRVVQRVQELLA